MTEVAYQYGRNIGLAFQFVDDLLDFVSSTEALGKPAAADLKLGLATAPVLFACEKVVVHQNWCLKGVFPTNCLSFAVSRIESDDHATVRREGRRGKGV